MNLYEQLGRTQIQIDRLQSVKESIVRQIEIQETIQAENSKKQEETTDAT